jgi:tetratricopeptide (TPR) repeat protein
MFAVQDEITGCVVQSIEPQLSRRELHRALRKHPQNLDSWDYTQRALSCLSGALSHLHAFAGADAVQARHLLHKAINLDPASSYAHSLLALSHFHDALADWTKDPPRALSATLEAARRAVELDDEDWLSHALFGIAILWTSRNHDRALEEVERAIALNPSAVIAYQFQGCAALFAGRPTQAVPALETVLHLDPQYQSRSLILADLSLARLLLGDVDDAVVAATEAVQGECSCAPAAGCRAGAHGAGSGSEGCAEDAPASPAGLLRCVRPRYLSIPIRQTPGVVQRWTSSGGMEGGMTGPEDGRACSRSRRDRQLPSARDRELRRCGRR